MRRLNVSGTEDTDVDTRKGRSHRHKEKKNKPTVAVGMKRATFRFDLENGRSKTNLKEGKIAQPGEGSKKETKWNRKEPNPKETRVLKNPEG